MNEDLSILFKGYFIQQFIRKKAAKVIQDHPCKQILTLKYSMILLQAQARSRHRTGHKTHVTASSMKWMNNGSFLAQLSVQPVRRRRHASARSTADHLWLQTKLIEYGLVQYFQSSHLRFHRVLQLFLEVGTVFQIQHTRQRNPPHPTTTTLSFHRYYL